MKLNYRNMNKLKIVVVLFITIVNGIINIYSQNHEIDSLLTIAQSGDFGGSEIEVYKKLGFKYIIYSTQKARIYQEKLDSIWEKTRNREAYMASLRLKAKIYRWDDEPHKAVKVYVKILEMAPEKIIEAEVYFNLGIIYSNLRLNDKSLNSFDKSLKLYKEINSYTQICNIYGCIADVYNYNLFNYDEAEKYYLLAISSYMIQNEESKLSNSGLQSLSVFHNNLGRLYIFTGDFDKSEKHLLQSIDLSEKINDELGKFHCSITLAELYRTNDYQMKAFDILKVFKDKYERYAFYLQAEYLREWSLILYEFKKIDEAYNAQVKYSNLKDSVFSKQILHKVTETELKYKQERLTYELKVKEERSRLIWLFSVIVVVFVILAIIYLFYNKKRKRESEKYNIEVKKEHDRNIQNNKLLKESLNQDEIKNLLVEVKSVLSQLSENKVVSEKYNDINSVLVKIKRKIKSVDNNFEERFSEIHNSFYDNLIKAHNNISTNERKLCAMLRLNMNNTEIATILNIEPKSVNVAKSRLKKKLNLNTEENINLYLTKF